MLETDDVDDDYFTPVASTSLANIFGKTVKKDENESLKYTAPKPVCENKPEVKSTACVFACALQGYVWFNNVYTSKGKLGFAVVKILKSEIHNIILYDSNKTTLSSALASPKLEVTLKGQNYISYYDDQRTYWSLYGTNDEIKHIIELLKEFGVTIKTSSESKGVPHDPDNSTNTYEQNPKTNEVQNQIENEQVTKKPEIMPRNYADTLDPADAKRTKNKNKASIINRMATVGLSVLPHLANTKSTDSESDSEVNIKPIKPKPKGLMKRNVANRMFEAHKKIDSEHSSEIEKIDTINVQHNVHDHQMVALPTTSIITSPPGIDMNLFATEQRINSSELRMNITRVSDKVDQVLNKINDISVKDNSNFNNEIMQKLIREYENKIKLYENLLNKGANENKQSLPVASDLADNETSSLKSRITHLENIIKDKNDYVLSLKNEIQALKEISASNESKHNKILLELEQELAGKSEKLTELSSEIENTNKTVKKDLESTVKSIMNETYQSISNNFDDTETYAGETIKNVIGKIIKQIVIKSLND